MLSDRDRDIMESLFVYWNRQIQKCSRCHQGNCTWRSRWMVPDDFWGPISYSKVFIAYIYAYTENPHSYINVAKIYPVI